MFSLNQRTERKKRKAEARTKAAFAAYVGLQKILKAAQAMISLERHIDGEFKAAQEERRDMDDPGNIVRPIIYSSVAIEDISTEEYFFLAKGKSANLVLEILELQQRARNNDAIVREFNRAKADYTSYLESRTHAVDELYSDHASFALGGNDAVVAVMKMGNLNTFIGQLLPALEEDVPRIKAVAQRFLDAAIIEFGEDFPKTKIEWIK